VNGSKAHGESLNCEPSGLTSDTTCRVQELRDLPTAAVAEALDRMLDSPPRLLPSGAAVSAALTARRAEVVSWVEGMFAGSWVATPESVVAASKARHGVRPIAIWDLPSQLAYAALTSQLEPDVSRPVRSSTAWSDFQKAPLEANSKYIVAADIASCYQAIDHGILAQELLERTGKSRFVRPLCELLQETGARSYGLPQQSQASDALAEAVLARLERAVLRKGLDLARYNDDFRFTCDSWSDVIRGIEVLSEEARGLGFVLNDSKVVTWSRVKYKNRLEAADRLRSEIAAEAELDLTRFEVEYDGDVRFVVPEPEEVDREAAARILERWQSVGGKGRVAEAKRSEHRALVELVPVALRGLSGAEEVDPTVLSAVMQMLRYEQTLTPAVCEFLLTIDDEERVLRAFDRLLADDAYLTGWQTWWLQQPLRRMTGLAKGRGSKRRKEWALAAFGNAEHSPLLRAEAAVTLARHRLITAAELLRVYDRSSRVERPTVVAAIGLVKADGNVRRSITGDSKLHEWIYDWAQAYG
jgi:RNA-directed DNA polymerase